jgi:hypothetical protein
MGLKRGVAAKISLRAFARARGMALSSVQRAIATGRLTKASVGRDEQGRPFIRDIATANAEWASHSRPYVDSRKW